MIILERILLKINGANGPTNVKVKVHFGNHVHGSVDQGQ